MNRRGFLNFALAAPVAAPMIAKAAAESIAEHEALRSWGIFDPEGFDLAGMDSYDDLITRHTLDERSVVIRLAKDRPPFVECEPKSDPFVTAQMDEHDLFETRSAA